MTAQHIREVVTVTERHCLLGWCMSPCLVPIQGSKARDSVSEDRLTPRSFPFSPKSFQGWGWSPQYLCHLLPPLTSDHFSIAPLSFRHPCPQHYHYFLLFQYLPLWSQGRAAFPILLLHDMGPLCLPDPPPGLRLSLLGAIPTASSGHVFC